MDRVEDHAVVAGELGVAGYPRKALADVAIERFGIADDGVLELGEGQLDLASAQMPLGAASRFLLAMLGKAGRTVKCKLLSVL
jgi:hypothetical protein